MIALTKGPVPQVLTSNSSQWTADLLAEIANGGDKVAYRASKYRHADIKAALKEETHRKAKPSATEETLSDGRVQSSQPAALSTNSLRYDDERVV